MDRKTTEKTSHPRDDEWEVDEPSYGFSPFQLFPAAYVLNGIRYTVTIQGFCKADQEQDNYRYRVCYLDGTVKVLDFVLGAGYIEEGIGQSEHARALGVCINRHFASE